ncbi:MAG: hypothetical protein ACYC92_09315 [Candidatus Acidiferrales bacterium]
MRSCIRTSAPGAKESLKWGMPAFSYRRYWSRSRHSNITSAFTPHRQR